MLKPLAGSKWDYTTAAHLLNRAGFGGTPAEVEHLVKLGPDKAVDQLVDYEKIPDETAAPDWAKPAPPRVDRFVKARDADAETRRKMVQEEQRTQRQRIVELKGWWLQRMAKGPRP